MFRIGKSKTSQHDSYNILFIFLENLLFLFFKSTRWLHNTLNYYFFVSTTSFEQLCINTANEELQIFFNFYVFREECDEYSQEGIKGKIIKYSDNRPILEMLLHKPLGLFDIIDEESKIRTATDLTLAEKFNKHFSAKKNIYTKLKSKPLHFIINHYAGPVTYGCGGFLEKNRHTLNYNLLDCLKMSQSQFVSDLYAAKLSATGSLQMK